MKAETFSATEKRVPSRFMALARFLLVGFTGIGVNELVYVGLVQNLGVWFVAAAILSTEVSTTWNFIGNERWAFSGRRFVGPNVGPVPVLRGREQHPAGAPDPHALGSRRVLPHEAGDLEPGRPRGAVRRPVRGFRWLGLAQEGRESVLGGVRRGCQSCRVPIQHREPDPSRLRF